MCFDLLDYDCYTYSRYTPYNRSFFVNTPIYREIPGLRRYWDCYNPCTQPYTRTYTACYTPSYNTYCSNRAYQIRPANPYAGYRCAPRYCR